MDLNIGHSGVSKMSWDVFLNLRNPFNNCLVETQGVSPYTALFLKSSTHAQL